MLISSYDGRTCTHVPLGYATVSYADVFFLQLMLMMTTIKIITIIITITVIITK